MFDFDRELAARYGVFASYQSDAAPPQLNTTARIPLLRSIAYWTSILHLGVLF